MLVSQASVLAARAFKLCKPVHTIHRPSGPVISGVAVVRNVSDMPCRQQRPITSPALQGIVFSVRPPKKSWKAIGNLSGGEKTLSSLSLVFALHHVRPTPLYFMDEIDAALDFKNVSIVAHYVKEQTRYDPLMVVVVLFEPLCAQVDEPLVVLSMVMAQSVEEQALCMRVW